MWILIDRSIEIIAENCPNNPTTKIDIKCRSRPKDTLIEKCNNQCICASVYLKFCWFWYWLKTSLEGLAFFNHYGKQGGFGSSGDIMRRRSIAHATCSLAKNQHEWKKTMSNDQFLFKAFCLVFLSSGVVPQCNFAKVVIASRFWN